MLSLEDKWLWDSWYVRDGDLWHAFYLQAPKAIGDPEKRHWNVSYGHATSRDLVTWDHLGTCFAPAEGKAWDDYTTWTGSVIRGQDDQWHLFYTGTSREGGGKYQKLGHAVSHDLHNWERVGNGPILDRDARYEEFQEGRWHDRAFRDPWVMRDPEGDGWIMYFTARDASVENTLEAGAIGFATSPDLFDWTLEDPIFSGGFGELEVPQVFEWGGTWYCLFCTGGQFWGKSAKALLGRPLTGNHYLIGKGPRGPWQLAPGPLLDATTYAGRLVNDGGTRKLLGFFQYDPKTEPFPGTISDPITILRCNDGRLVCADQQ